MPEIPFNFLSLLYCTVRLPSEQKWKTQIPRLLTDAKCGKVKLYNTTDVGIWFQRYTSFCTEESRGQITKSRHWGQMTETAPLPPPHIFGRRGPIQKKKSSLSHCFTPDRLRTGQWNSQGLVICKSQEASSLWPATPRCLPSQVRYASHPQWSGHWLWDPLQVPTPTNSATTPMHRLHRWPCTSFQQHQRMLQPCILRLLLFSFFLFMMRYEPLFHDVLAPCTILKCGYTTTATTSTVTRVMLTLTPTSWQLHLSQVHLHTEIQANIINLGHDEHDHSMQAMTLTSTS